MRILFTVDKLDRGGKEKQLLIVAKGLLERGNEVQIISQNPINPTNFYHEIGFPEKHILALATNTIQDKKKLFYQAINHFKPNIVLCWELRLQLWLYKKKFIFPIVNCSIRRGVHYSKLKARLISYYLAKKSSYTIANSKAGLNLYGLQENENTAVIYNAVNNPKVDATITFEELFDRKKEANDKLLVSVGGLYPHKNQVALLKSMKLSTNKNLFAIIIGNGSDRKKLETFIAQNNLSERVKLLGIKTNVEAYLQISDAFVNCSNGEGCSNAIIEAMVLGLPIITTPNGGTVEIAFPPITQYYKFNAIPELVKTFHQLTNKETINTSELKNWLEKFDETACIDQYEAFILRIIK